MPRTVVLLAIAGLLAVAGLSCSPPAQESASAEPQMELRTYQVPAGYEDETRSVLRSVLHSKENEQGRVSMGPGGQLVVLAPASVQRGVEELVKQVEAVGQSPTSVPITIAFDWWFVVARPAEKPAAASLPEIASALQAVSESQGAMQFELLERFRLLSKDNEDSRATGALFQVQQRASVIGNRIAAWLQVGRAASMQTEVYLEPGQQLVLAQTGFEDRSRGEGLMLLIIVRAELLAADG